MSAGAIQKGMPLYLIAHFFCFVQISVSIIRGFRSKNPWTYVQTSVDVRPYLLRTDGHIPSGRTAADAWMYVLGIKPPKNAMLYDVEHDFEAHQTLLFVQHAVSRAF